MSEQDWVHIDILDIIRETEKAFLLRLEDGEERWVPKSVVSDADDYEVACGPASISLAGWFCEKEDIG